RGDRPGPDRCGADRCGPVAGAAAPQRRSGKFLIGDKDMTAILRLPAEQTYAPELQALARGDDAQKPEGWSLSPKAVLTYLLGGKAADGTVITPKYVGSRRLME